MEIPTILAILSTGCLKKGMCYNMSISQSILHQSELYWTFFLLPLHTPQLLLHFSPGVNRSDHKKPLIYLNIFSGSKVKTRVFNVTLRLLLLLRMLTKSDTLPILIDACFLRILGNFYPIWIILDNFQQSKQWEFHRHSIKTNLSNISQRYEQEETLTFFYETPCTSTKT